MLDIEARAAVALIKTESEDPEYLIIERAQNPRDPWSGQLAFPGGHREKDDKNLLQTGIREAFEETGIELTMANLSGELAVHQAGRGHEHPVLVAPYLFTLPEKMPTKIDKKEVSSVIWVRQSHLLDKSKRTLKEINFKGNDLSFPGINIENKILWGFTYMVFKTHLTEEGLPFH